MPRDDVARREFVAPAVIGQYVGKPSVAERLGQPIAQRTHPGLAVIVGGNNGVLAELERAVHVGKDRDVFGDDRIVAESLLDRGRQVHQHQARAQRLGGLFDLRETMDGG